MSSIVRRLGGTLIRATSSLGESWFTWRFGSETTDCWFLDEHGLAGADQVWYVPTEWLGLRRAFRRLKPGGSDVLLDIGSGKGRALLVAGMCPFRRIIGVELAEQMTEVARIAVTKNQHKLKCRQIELATSNALTYDIPPDVNIVYMYCPFVGPVFAQFIERLLEFADRCPHPVRLVYNYPMEHTTLLATKRFEVLDVCSAKWPPRALTRPEVIITYGVLRSTDPAGSFPSGLNGQAVPSGARCWLGPYDPGFVVWRSEGRVWRSSQGWRDGA